MRLAHACNRAAASHPAHVPTRDHLQLAATHSRLTTTRQPALAPYSATARALLVARQRRPTASAPFSAAQATPARHLAPGTARTHPQACPLAFVAATTPCKLQRGGSPASSSTAVEPTSPRYKRRPPSSSENSGDLRPPPWHPHSQQSSGESRLPQLRPVRSPPRPSSIHRNQSPSRPSNAAK